MNLEHSFLPRPYERVPGDDQLVKKIIDELRSPTFSHYLREWDIYADFLLDHGKHDREQFIRNWAHPASTLWADYLRHRHNWVVETPEGCVNRQCVHIDAPAGDGCKVVMWLHKYDLVVALSVVFNLSPVCTKWPATRNIPSFITRPGVFFRSLSALYCKATEWHAEKSRQSKVE